VTRLAEGYALRSDLVRVFGVEFGLPRVDAASSKGRRGNQVSRRLARVTRLSSSAPKWHLRVYSDLRGLWTLAARLNAHTVSIGLDEV
jgi:hypothetical protein